MRSRSTFTPRFFALPLVAALVAFGTGCGDNEANAAPIIDSVEAPLAVAEVNGAYAIPVTILFHDIDREAVTHVRYRVGASVDMTVELPAPNPTRESAHVTLYVPKAACGGAGRHAVELSLLDARGAESMPLPHHITLE